MRQRMREAAECGRKVNIGQPYDQLASWRQSCRSSDCSQSKNAPHSPLFEIQPTPQQLISMANQPRRPPVPSLSATPAEIRSFLVDFFTYLDGSLTLPEAEERANKLPLDGKGLYEISPQQWLEVYGLQGQAICQELQESEFGYRRLAVIGSLPTWLGKFLGPRSFSQEESNTPEKTFTSPQPSSPERSSLQKLSSATTSSGVNSSSTVHSF